MSAQYHQTIFWGCQREGFGGGIIWGNADMCVWFHEWVGGAPGKGKGGRFPQFPSRGGSGRQKSCQPPPVGGATPVRQNSAKDYCATHANNATILRTLCLQV